MADSLDQLALEIDHQNNPILIELPALTDMNRHIQMSHQRHVDLVALVLRLFDVPTSAFEALYARQDTDIAAIMGEKGWPVIPLEERETKGSAFQLDMMTIIVEQKDDDRPQRGGIVMQRNDEGILRTSFDLTVALLALGVFVQSLRNAASTDEANIPLNAGLEKAALSLMMDVPEAATRWLNTPLKALGSMTPYNYAEQNGAQDVLHLINRLKDGKY